MGRCCLLRLKIQYRLWKEYKDDDRVDDRTCFVRPGDIWHNVIIACKQSRNPEDDTQGALAAAKHYNPKADPVLLGYTFIGKLL